MDGLIPWESWKSAFDRAGRGRRPYELGDATDTLVQLFYNLSDPGMEDMLYEVESVRL